MSDENRWVVTPKSTAPEDIEAALLAEKIANSPAFIEAYGREFRRRLHVMVSGDYTEYWDFVEPE